LGFSNEEVLAAHAHLMKRAVQMNPADRRRATRLSHPAPGTSVAPQPAASRAAPTLRVYPPVEDNVRAGIDGVLAGAYDVPGLVFSTPPRILDIGGHVGSATVRFAQQYPGARIHTYEPSPANAHFCEQNVAGISTLVRAAVVGPGKPATVRLYDGKQNTGQRSIYQLGEQLTTGVDVPTVSADTLPPCEILKADCEGCELEILRAYPHLGGVRAIMLEWHRDEDYRELLRWLPSLGFELVRDTAKGAHVGDRNLIFVRPRTLPAADSPVIWQCPRSSLSIIAELHGYNLGGFPSMAKPTILDVGGHVGGFVWEALRRWPDGRVVTFEPHPETFRMLANNLRGLNVEAHHAAVVHPQNATTMRLYEGVNGSHECSLRSDIVWGPDASNPKPHVSQQLDKWVDVPTFDAAMLPPADVMKVDCEGVEVDILSAYRHLRGVRVLVTEAHAVGGDVRGQAEKIAQIAQAAGLKWIGPDRIIARFVRP
jgi:FkbM family methyltransferase